MEETRRAFHSQKQRACVIAVWVRPGKTGIESLLSPAYWSPWHRWALPESSSSSNLPQEWDAQRQRTDNEGTTPRVRVRADWPGSATKAAKAVSENRCWFVHRLERMRLLHCLVIWRTVFTSLTALGCSLKARNPLLPAKCPHIQYKWIFLPFSFIFNIFFLLILILLYSFFYHLCLFTASWMQFLIF